MHVRCFRHMLVVHCAVLACMPPDPSRIIHDYQAEGKAHSKQGTAQAKLQSCCCGDRLYTLSQSILLCEAEQQVLQCEWC